MNWIEFKKIPQNYKVHICRYSKRDKLFCKKVEKKRPSLAINKYKSLTHPLLFLPLLQNPHINNLFCSQMLKSYISSWEIKINLFFQLPFFYLSVRQAFTAFAWVLMLSYGWVLNAYFPPIAKDVLFLSSWRLLVSFFNTKNH